MCDKNRRPGMDELKKCKAFDFAKGFALFCENAAKGIWLPALFQVRLKKAAGVTMAGVVAVQRQKTNCISSI